MNCPSCARKNRSGCGRQLPPDAAFCDGCGHRLAGSPAEGAERSPRDYTPKHLTEDVHRFEGTVNQYTGDGIMALFGAPIAHEDHAQRAAYAALHLVETLRPFAREVKREHGVTLSTRIGLNSGDVVVGKIGDDLRMDYTAQGHTVGLAQRMEALASPDTIDENP